MCSLVYMFSFTFKSQFVREAKIVSYNYPLIFSQPHLYFSLLQVKSDELRSRFKTVTREKEKKVEIVGPKLVKD